MKKHIAINFTVLLLLSGCWNPPTPVVNPTSVPTETAVVPIQPGLCILHGLLPDPVCTPGVADPRVTQLNIGTTICVPGYSTRIRDEKSESYFATIKRQKIRAYGLPGPTSAYELDHLISLELGGSNDEKNLWPESPPTPNPKDHVEGEAHSAICKGRLTLDHAQKQIAQDWTMLGREIGAFGP